MTSELSLLLVPALTAAALLVAGMVDPAAQDELADETELTLAARVLFDDGAQLELSDFHLGTGYYRHRLSTGRQPLLLPLETVDRIVRMGDSDDAIRVVFTNGTEMTTLWRHPGAQRLHGILPDGSFWEGTIVAVREILILRPDDEGADASTGDEEQPSR